MTTAHVEKFAELLASDHELRAKLGLDQSLADDAGAEESRKVFIANAVIEGAVRGLSFSDEEAREFFKQITQQAADGELSDLQLATISAGFRPQGTRKPIQTTIQGGSGNDTLTGAY